MGFLEFVTVFGYVTGEIVASNESIRSPNEQGASPRENPIRNPVERFE